MIATDGHRARAGIGDAAEEGADARDAGLVVHGLGQRDIAQIVDAARLPGGEVIEGFVQPPVMGGDVAHRARPQMLVALGGAVAGGVGHADQRDVAGAGIGIDGAAEEGGNAPPGQRLQQHHVVVWHRDLRCWRSAIRRPVGQWQGGKKRQRRGSRR